MLLIVNNTISTILVIGGMFSLIDTCSPLTTCPMISELVKFLINPILPVKQKAQPRSQPICVDTHKVVRSNLTDGISTDSTCRLSASSFCNNFNVPQSN